MERGGKGEIKNWKRKGKGTGEDRRRYGKESRLCILKIPVVAQKCQISSKLLVLFSSVSYSLIINK